MSRTSVAVFRYSSAVRLAAGSRRLSTRVVGGIHVAEHLRSGRLLQPLGVRDVDVGARVSRPGSYRKCAVECSRSRRSRTGWAGCARNPRRRWGRWSRWPRPACDRSGLCPPLSTAAFRSGRESSAVVVKLVERRTRSEKSNGPVTSNSVHRRLPVQQRQHRDLGGPQVHLRGLEIRFVLHALERAGG